MQGIGASFLGTFRDCLFKHFFEMHLDFPLAYYVLYLSSKFRKARASQAALVSSDSVE